MNSRKWCMLAAAAALLMVPLIAIGQQQARAVRQSGTNCFLSVGFASTALVDLYAGPGSGTFHDWGIGSTKMAADGGTIYCPVTLDVPLADKNPIKRVRIAYATRDNPVSNANPAGVVPEIKTCTAFLMDGTAAGTWVGQTNPNFPAGDPTNSLYTDHEITIDQATVPLGSGEFAPVRRMLITCTLPRGVLLGTSINSTYTALIKGYEVQYEVSP
jgi:hypothetical protein